MKVWTYLVRKMHELKDYESADEICTEAQCLAQPDEDFIKMFFQTSMQFDQSVIKPLKQQSNNPEKLALSKRVLDRAERSLRGTIKGYMTNAEAGQRFGWAAELNPDNGYALYREAMCLYLNTKYAIEDGNTENEWARNCLAEAREKTERASKLIPETKGVWSQLESIDLLIAQCS